MRVGRARRRWQKWDAYLRRIGRLDPQTAKPHAAYKAYDGLRSHLERKRIARARRYSCSLAGAVLAALDESRAAA